VKIGKDLFEFSFYKFFAEKLPKKSIKDYYFAHCALVLSWNMFSWVSNGLGMKFGHVER
jgi:hypothetical protein